MIDYVDPVPPVVRFLSTYLPDIQIHGNQFSNPTYPALLVKNTGGIDYTRIQLRCRAQKDYEAMNGLIHAMNTLTRYAANISGLRVMWCGKETNPIPSEDADSNMQEAWCYMRLEHLEA